ncbi:hypothetical protein DFJ74DRAFT_703967 [Hyaloraphidium curvatum]|nr:hypothetical protein DFJ74DRAFT_703967 [Hyaloraphidium curvatum]
MASSSVTVYTVNPRPNGSFSAVDWFQHLAGIKTSVQGADLVLTQELKDETYFAHTVLGGQFLRINVDNEYHSDDYYRIIPRTIAAAPALEKLEIFTEPDADATCFDDDDEGVSWFHDMSTPPFPTSFLLATDSPHGLLDLLDFIWTDLCSGWLSKAEEVVIMGTVLDSTPCFPAAKRALLCFDALWEERLMECKDAMLPNAQDIVVAHDMRTGRGGIVSYSDIASLMEQRPSLKRVGYVKIGDDRVGNDGKIASFDGKLWRMRQFDPKTYFSDDSGWVEASNLDVHVFFVDYCEDRLCGCHEVITGSTYDELFSGEV